MVAAKYRLPAPSPVPLCWQGIQRNAALLCANPSVACVETPVCNTSGLTGAPAARSKTGLCQRAGQGPVIKGTDWETQRRTCAVVLGLLEAALVFQLCCHG